MEDLLVGRGPGVTTSRQSLVLTELPNFPAYRQQTGLVARKGLVYFECKAVIRDDLVRGEVPVW